MSVIHGKHGPGMARRKRSAGRRTGAKHMMPDGHMMPDAEMHRMTAPAKKPASKGAKRPRKY